MSLDDDVFNWVWQVCDTSFIVAIHEGYPGYYLVNEKNETQGEFVRWNNVHIVTRDTSYRKARPYINPSLYGPHQPPLSPVIKKIREMAKRRETNPNTLNVPVW